MRNLRIVLVVFVILAIGVTAYYFNRHGQVARPDLGKWEALLGDIKRTLDESPLLLEKYLQLLDNDPSLTAEEKISIVEENILAELNGDN